MNDAEGLRVIVGVIDVKHGTLCVDLLEGVPL